MGKTTQGVLKMSDKKENSNKHQRTVFSKEIRSKEHNTAPTERPPKMKPESKPKSEQEG